jgi:hypothetical protein
MAAPTRSAAGAALAALVALVALAAVAAAAAPPGYEVTSGGGVLKLPQDHALHSKHPLYDKSNDFMEW